MMTVLSNSVARRSANISLASASLLAIVPGTVFLVYATVREIAMSSAGAASLLADDAMVSMTYAKTLAFTGELVWVPGAARVQGYTNPLWTLYMSLLHSAGLSGESAAIAISLTGIGCVLGSAFLVSMVVGDVLADSSSRMLAAAFAGGSIPFLIPLAYWSIGGMEVGLLSLLTMSMMWAGWKCTVRDMRSRVPLIVLCVSAALGTATRLDFVVVVAVFSIAIAVAGLSSSAAWRATVTLASAVATIAAVLGWQHLYYGQWLPNTYYLKLEGFSLAERVSRGSAVSLGRVYVLLAVSLIAAATVWVASEQRRSRFIAVCGVGVPLGVTCYSIYVGGDAWEYLDYMNRFLSVGLASGTVVIFVALGTLISRAKSGALHKDGAATGLKPVIVFGLAATAIAVGAIAIPELPLGPRGRVLQVALPLLCAAAIWAPFRWVGPSSKLSYLTKLCCAVTAAGLISATGLQGWHGWVRYGFDAARLNEKQVEYSRAVRTLLPESSKVAVFLAGYSGYYIYGRMLDLLGKSDSRIAHMPPQTSAITGEKLPLYPGHNKWDFEYSFAELTPDAVLHLEQLYDASTPKLEEMGYMHLCSGVGDVWVKRNLNGLNLRDWQPCS